MTARRTPYPAAGHTLRIPEDLWNEGLAELRGYGQLRSEGLVFFGGVVAANDTIVVTSVLRLGHAAQGGTVVVSNDEARWLIRTLRERDEKLVSQLHSHAGAAFHSHGDDAHASSFHEGFLSVVAPHWGAVAAPEECAIYEFRGGEFTEIPSVQAAARVTLGPVSVERQPPPWRHTSRKESWWSGLSRKMKRIARSAR